MSTRRFYVWKGVRYVAPWKPAPESFVRCGACGRAWDDDKPTGWTPAPSGRCPFEYWHKGALPRRVTHHMGEVRS